GILGDAGNCMDKFIEESPDADKFASSLESLLELTEEESRFYAAKGIESNVSSVLSPFRSLSGGVKKITFFQVVFITNYGILKNESDYEAYVSARTAVITMRAGADGINSSLDGIERIELWNETSMLLFNVSELRDKLKDVYALIDHYEKLLEQYEIEVPAFEEYLLVVVVSDDHPFLYEEIEIYVYARNVTALSLFVDNASYELKNQTGEQTKEHSFEEPGEHVIYAEGITEEGENITSNIVKVFVNKIPTFITLSSKYAAFVNERVKITGLLVDYHNEPLHGANVTVKIRDEETELTAGRSGSFEFYGTKNSEGHLNVSAFYPGNNTYKSSSANISIFFSRFPVSLHIEADETHINVNETVNFTGSVYGINSNYAVPLIIFVNDTSVKTVTGTKDFNFSLLFSNPGTYEVYAFFPGDSLFKPAESNVVKITVIEKAEVAGKRVEGIISKFNLLFYLLLILVAIISFFAGLYARTLKRKLHTLGERLRIPAGFSFTHLHSRTPKVKMHALGSKLHAFRAKILTPIASIFTVIYARAFKWKFYAFSKGKNKLRALMEKKGTELKNRTAENPGIEVVEEEKEYYEEVPEVDILEGVDLEGAYKLLFDTMVDKYNLKKSFTARELLELIKKKKEPFMTMLEEVTEIYEKAVYGNVELVAEEREIYFKGIEEILRYFKG
ncbi:MAG: Ig-like domain-containing protein, partial [archaeon]|nr:Ig-like domain-containing protein [archaeon]